MNNENEDDNYQYIQLSDMEEAMLATFSERIAELAQDAVQGKDSVHENLAALVDVMPDAARTEIVKRFRAMVQELKAGAGLAVDELTPEQEAEMKYHKERETSMIAHWLSQKTMKKLREAILTTPGILGAIMSIGEDLQRKGVIINANVTNKDVGGLSAQQMKNAEHFAAKNQDKNLER